MLVILKSGDFRAMIETNNLAGVIEDLLGTNGEKGQVYVRMVGITGPLPVNGTFEEVCAKLGFTGSFAP